MDPSAFTREIETFAQIDPDMGLTAMLVFMFVAQRGLCNQKDLEVGLGMNNASASRSVSYWTTKRRAMVDGVGFIAREEDPMDRRYKVLTLTKKGQAFYNRLKEKDGGKASRVKVAS